MSQNRGMPSAFGTRLQDWPLRVARQDAPAILRRGGTVPIHAAIIGPDEHGVVGFRTACGRWFPLGDELRPGGVSCAVCCRAFD